MKITPFGAVREVTGSCYMLETDQTKILVDCGLFQGGQFAQAKNYTDFGFSPHDIDAIVLTHAHIDHSGRIPQLVKRGFTGPIYTTPPTKEFVKLLWYDAEMIMFENQRKFNAPALFTKEDVKVACRKLKAIDDSGAICFKDLQIQFHNAGHILGSAFVEITEDGGKTVTFSGDLGNIDTPILKQKDALNKTDVLFIESTYGDRIHEKKAERWQILKDAVTETINQGGVLLIPAFAIERTQELLLELNNLAEKKRIPRVDIFMDSPLAAKVTDVFQAYPNYYSVSAYKQMVSGDALFDFPGLEVTRSREQSKKINDSKWPKVIIAGAGMMNGGRIQHHLVRYLSDTKCTVLIIGFQAHGTLGRKLYSGQKRVKVLDEYVTVKANIVSIGGFSAHADQKMLVSWIRSAKKRPTQVYCTHGEEQAASALATRITEALHIPADVPRPGQTITV
jgi:metallo-beta-lactamase family protein